MTRPGKCPEFSAFLSHSAATLVHQTPGFPDVISSDRKPTGFSLRPKPNDPWTNIYFVREGERGAFKIGVSAQSPLGRLHTLQVGNPRELHLLGWVYAPASLERWLHADLAPDNIQGEWFKPTKEVRDAIAETIESWGPMPCQECDRQEYARLRDARVAPRPHTCGRVAA